MAKQLTKTVRVTFDVTLKGVLTIYKVPALLATQNKSLQAVNTYGKQLAATEDMILHAYTVTKVREVIDEE